MSFFKNLFIIFKQIEREKYHILLGIRYRMANKRKKAKNRHIAYF